jgi:hypothetical protein
MELTLRPTLEAVAAEELQYHQLHQAERLGLVGLPVDTLAPSSHQQLDKRLLILLELEELVAQLVGLMDMLEELVEADKLLWKSFINKEI